MSYILDALKKAESERERGVVPGLGSTQTSYSTYISYGASYKPWWLVLLALGLLVALVLGTWAWRQTAGDAVPVPATRLAPAAAAPAAPVPANPTPVMPVPLAAQKPEPPGAQVAQVLQVAPATMPRASAPVASSTMARVPATAAPAPASPVAPPPVAATPPQAEPAAKAVPPVASPVRATAGAIPQLSELSEALRRQIPALTISGAIYSDTPPEWTLIINDQVMSRGSQVAPDLRLEDISASSAVFNFRGQRFRVDR
jgi:general secretion pathway protein B